MRPVVRGYEIHTSHNAFPTKKYSWAYYSMCIVVT